MKQPFLFGEQTATWLGQGEISFSLSSEVIPYYTKWQLEKLEEGQVRATQKVELQGEPEPVVNHYLFYKIDSKSFKVRVDSASYGKNEGEGLINDECVAWEFHGEGLPFEGLEKLHLQEDGTYHTHAEFVSEENLRTFIEGKIWLSSEES